MSSLVQLGDVPAWIGAATGAASLYQGLRARRQKQAVEWAQIVEQLSGLSEEEVRRAVENSPVVAEIVGVAWEKAAETASDYKRRLLAMVAAAAIRGDAAASVDELQFLLRTVSNLDPAHVTLLVLIGTPQPERDPTEGKMAEGAVSRAEMRTRWANDADLLDPALATLEREGLIDRSGFADDNGEVPASLNGYGKRFLDFLLIDKGGWPPAVGDTEDPRSPMSSSSAAGA